MLVNDIVLTKCHSNVRNGDVKEKVEKEVPPEPPVNDQQQQVLAKVKATGGVQMMIIPNENQAPPTTKEEEPKASAHRSNWTLVVKVNVAR